MKDFDVFKELQKKQKAYQYVLTLASWDSNTEAPKESFPFRSEMLGIISGEHFSLMTDKEYVETVNDLHENNEDQNDKMK